MLKKNLISQLQIFSLFIIPFLAFSFTYSSPVWRLFKSYEGKFSILLPDGSFAEKTIPIKTNLGNLEQHSFYFAPDAKDAENKFFQLSYIDYPNGTFSQDSTELIELFYQTTIESAAESVGGKVMYSDDTQVHKVKGKIWRIDYNHGNSVMKSKAFLVGNRFYTISVATVKARARNLEANKFLESFEFIGKY